MNENRKKLIQEKTAVYSYGLRNDVLNLFMVMEKYDITIAEIKFIFMEEKQRRIDEFKKATEEERRRKGMSKAIKSQWQKNGRKCPECGHALSIRGIHVAQCKRNVNGYKSQWFCEHPDCVFEEYSVNASETEILKYVTVERR